MIAKILAGVCLSLLLLCGFLYYSLDSAKSKVVSLQDTIVILKSEVANKEDQIKKAKVLKEKSEEIVKELLLNQDTTQEQFVDLTDRFQALKRVKPCNCKQQETSGEQEISNTIVVDFSEHKRVFSEAACLAGNSGACSSAVITK